MGNSASRLSGFFKKSIEDRRRLLSENTGVSLREIVSAVGDGGLTTETADKFVENVIGTYALPFAVVLNVSVNTRDYVVPVVVEEPSVVAAASNAAKIVRAHGGFQAEVDPPIMTCQVQIYDVPDALVGAERIMAEKASILADANLALPGLVARGGGARQLEVRSPTADMLVVHLYVDCRDAMGANLVNTVAEAVGDRLAVLGGGCRGLRILSNLSDRRCARVRCVMPVSAFQTETRTGEEVARGIVNASRFAAVDPYRAATHNKGIMNGIDAVCLATGNDWRAVEAGAHAFAARSGRYEPLSTWRIIDPDRTATALEGTLLLPMALGTVGGTLRVHPSAKLALRLLGATSAGELAGIAASVGLASNLAALRALATDGIQKGHMALHARAVAVAAGAVGAEVDKVALLIVEARDITKEGAVHALETLRASSTIEEGQERR